MIAEVKNIAYFLSAERNVYNARSIESNYTVLSTKNVDYFFRILNLIMQYSI
jgi:hypothetical protein